ncbi:MAG: lipid-A-disaccharide synthase [Alphaproteobacteria bacterium]|jgi:lipid-A-disaccharide synthase|nr:lipid-A-disaccharide synthase [Alphaproteobacteria bacterium]
MVKLKKKIFIIAGEASGDILASSIMEKIIDKKKDVAFVGMGGEEMQKVSGFKSIIDIKDFSVMGFVEVLKRYRTLKRKIDFVVDEIVKAKPDVIMSVDAPSLAKAIILRAKKRGVTVPCVHIVAPQVWAWRPKRAKKYAKVFDEILCFFKFEEPFFTKYGGKIKAIGHPAIERYKGDHSAFTNKYKFVRGKKIIALIPGSREAEIDVMLPVLKEVSERLRDKYNNCSFFMPLVESTEDKVRSIVETWDAKPAFVKGSKDRYDMFARSNLAICASGTVSLELAIRNVPTVACYKVSKLTHFIIKRFISIKYFSLVNILSDEMIIPELFQDELTADNVFNEACKVLDDKDYKKKYTKKIKPSIDMLKAGAGMPSTKAATEVLKYIK